MAAQSYPNKPVRAIVPYPPGGIVDIMGRTIAERVSAQTGNQVLIENRGGANGMIGTEAVLAAPADGYTWLIASASHVSNASIYKGQLRWDPIADFMPIGMFGKSYNFLVVPSSSPAKTVADLVSKTDADLLKVRSFGRTSLREVKKKLQDIGLDLGTKLPEGVQTTAPAAV